MSQPGQAQRILLAIPPSAQTDGSAWLRGDWPARWIQCPGTGPAPQVTLFRLPVRCPRTTRVRIHVTADERYDLYLDGRVVGRGSQRGSPWRWHFETYDLRLPPGRHTLVARVWCLGAGAPVAQMSVRAGFLLRAEGSEASRFSTGLARWSARPVEGYQFLGGPLTWGSGQDEVVDGAGWVPGWERGRGSGWRTAESGSFGVDARSNADRIGQVHRLAPATLPPQVDRMVRRGRIRQVDVVEAHETRAIPVCASAHLAAEAPAWQRWWRGGTLRVPPRTSRRVIVDLEDYYCLYPQLRVRGGAGAVIRLHWAESLYEAKPDPRMADDHVWSRPKGHRDQVEGKYFVGHGPTWKPGRGRRVEFDTRWWQAGRYVEVHVQTGAQALWLEKLTLRETRYPLENEGRLVTDDPGLTALQPILLRGLQMCAHETYQDCPYWEQLMYTGDTRLQALCGYVLMRDDRLQRTALRLFADSRLPSGLTQSRFPTANGQVIPPFSLFWIGLLHDHALWRGDETLVRELLPCVRSILEAHERERQPDGLVAALPGWNFVDWVPGWKSGEPPGSRDGFSSVLMGQLVVALRQAAELELLAGDRACAQRWSARAQELARAMRAAFYHAPTGRLADDRSHTSFSEHAQALGLLGGVVRGRLARKVVAALVRGGLSADATIYFSHYVLEALAAAGAGDALVRRLELWKNLAPMGFRTPYEAPGATRSDCHAWSSHPLYHMYASLAGIRPDSFGFRTVCLRPLLGSLSQLDVALPHPKGMIRFKARRNPQGVLFVVHLPRGVAGRLEWQGRRYALTGGRSEVVP